MYQTRKCVRTMAIAMVFCALSETGAFAQEQGWLLKGARPAEDLVGQARRTLYNVATRNTFQVNNGSSSVYLGKTPLYGLPVFTAVKHTWPHDGGDNCPITQVINPWRGGSIAHLKDKEDLINGRMLLFSSRKAPAKKAGSWDDDIVLWTPMNNWSPGTATGVNIGKANKVIKNATEHDAHLISFGYSNGRYIKGEKYVKMPSNQIPKGLLCSQRLFPRQLIGHPGHRSLAKWGEGHLGMHRGYSGGPVFDIQSKAVVGINVTISRCVTLEDLLTKVKIAEARSPFENEELGAMGHYGHPEVVKDLLNLIQAKLQ